MKQRLCCITFLLLSLPRTGWTESIEAIPQELLDPIVLVGCMDYTARGKFSLEMPRMGFAIGDGTLIVTAEHCVDSFRDPAPPSSSRLVFAISPYYGDIYPLRLLASDDRADVALLQADWASHPAFDLADPCDLHPDETLWIPSIPQFIKDKHLNTTAYLETLCVEHIDYLSETPSIRFTQKGRIEPGWSGSPVILPTSHKIAGLMVKITGTPQRRALFFKRMVYKGFACHVEAIPNLLNTQGLALPEYPHPPIRPADANSKAALSDIQGALNALLVSDLYETTDHLKKSVALRPDSAYLHLWLATFMDFLEENDKNEQDIECPLMTAIQRRPKDPHILAVSAHLLKGLNKPEQAQQYAQEALIQDPNNALALYTQLTLLQDKDPDQAVQWGRRLIDLEPNNAMACFYTSMALLNYDPEEALHVAQQAVAIDPNGVLRNPMARAFAALHRNDEALVEYRYMTEHCGCESCWYQYCRFLTEQYPDRISEAQNALDQARSTSKKKGLPSNHFDTLQVNIYKQSDPNQAMTFLETKLDQDPNDAHTWWCLTDVLRQQTKYQEATDAAQKAVDLDPNNSYVPRLANCLTKAGHVTAARTMYDRMLTEHPERSRYWLN